MDRVLFCTKRAHLSYTTHANRLLAKWRLTAARMDLIVCHRSALSHHGVVYQSTLCARLGVARSTIAVMLRRLEKLGFVERRRSDGDRRKIVVTITAAGYAAFEKARYLVDQGAYRKIVDGTLLFIDYGEPVPTKRARFLSYVDGLRATFGDLTTPPYALETATVSAQDRAMQDRVDDLLRRFVPH